MSLLPRIAAIVCIAYGTYASTVAPVKTRTMKCSHDHTDKDGKVLASYDLSKLKAMSMVKPLLVKDRMQVAEKDYLYTVGICTTVAPPANCRKADGSSRVDPDTAPAWQTNASQTEDNTPDIADRHCVYAGGSVLDEDAKWDILDKENPGAGVSLTYTRGQHCSSGQRRALTLNFKCSKSAGIEQIDQNVMDESAHCKYEITIESQYACPTQCGFGGGHSLCNDHGVCGYDSDAKTARCFCNEGFTGNGCDSATESQGLQGYGPILGLLIFVTIAIVALVAAVIALWRYMSARTVPLDGDSYARLDNFGEPTRTEVKGPDGL